VPSISGRVVKGLGLTLLMGHRSWGHSAASRAARGDAIEVLIYRAGAG
jgi:hypothetical protein